MTDIVALGKLNTAIARFLHKYPLLGGLLATWSTVEDASVETMAVGMGQNGIILYYAPLFVRRITVGGLIAVLHHEVRHVVYGHVFFNPEDFPDHNALVTAEEVTVNENLPERLPIRGILLKDYPKLKPNQDTATRYNILAKQITKQQPKGAPDGLGQSSGGNSNGGTKGSDKSQNSKPGKDSGNADADDATDKQGQSSTSNPNGGANEPRNTQNTNAGAGTGSSDQAGPPGGRIGKGQQPDNHERWASIKKDESFAKATIESTLRDLINRGIKPTKYEQKVFKETIKDCGSGAGNGLTMLGDSDRRTKSWQSLLRRYVGKELKSVPCYQRPARRFPDLVGIVPGRYPSAGRPRVMAGIDTSASMSDGDLAEISKELHSMSAHYEVHVVEFDDIVHRHYKFNGPIKSVLGRGGTCFIPLFDKEIMSKIKPDLITVFTDGGGDAPENRPRVPVIWVLTTGGEVPAKWGRVIHMGKETEATSE